MRSHRGWLDVRQGERLENALRTAGGVSRVLTDRVERLERHTGLEPPSP